MIFTFKSGSDSYNIDTGKPLDISIPLIFNGEQPNTYDVEKAAAKPYETSGLIGDVRQGGGCNFEEYTLIPHCNGTHTECVGHISHQRISINETFKDCFIPSMVITLQPVSADETPDTYIPGKESGDMLITKSSIEDVLENVDSNFLKGLIIRTLPNDDSKKSRRYMENMPSFFSVQAIEYIASLDIEHLLIDIPSVDRTFDEGKLTVHHIFWDVMLEKNNVDTDNYSMKTITEMVYISDEIDDGKYISSIQIPNFIADAAPSRVFLYKPIL